jgi:hypothetical protein
MRRKHVLFALLALVVAGALVYFNGSRVPSGQPPLERLTPQTLAGIKERFNAAKDRVRVLLLLSPT